MHPKLMNPTEKEIFRLKDKTIEIPKCVITFSKWGRKPPKETFGGKPIVCVDNKPMFAEMAIMKYFIMSGWKSRWIETYGRSNKEPIYLSKWKDAKFKNQTPDPITDKYILDTLSGIASCNNNSYSGCWDVIGWTKDRIVFAEAKRANKDRIRQTQINWLSAGLDYGLRPDNFLVVKWDMQ